MRHDVGLGTRSQAPRSRRCRMAELEAPALLEMVCDPKASGPVGREGRPHEPLPRLDEQVRTSFERSRGTYGYRRARR